MLSQKKSKIKLKKKEEGKKDSLTQPKSLSEILSFGKKEKHKSCYRVGDSQVLCLVSKYKKVNANKQNMESRQSRDR